MRRGQPAGATLHFGDMRRNLLGAFCRLLHVAGDLLRCRALLLSTAAAMAEDTSDSFSMVPLISPIASTDSCARRLDTL